MSLIRSAFAVALAAALASMAAAPWAQQTLEIIPLRHRTVEQVLPVLRPLLEPGGTLTGQSGQLVVRASPANLDEIRRALDAIDRPLRRLQISVRFDDAADAASRNIEASGSVSNRGSRVELRAAEARSAQSERIDQRIQVLEGGWARISTGQARSLPQAGVIQEIDTGFDVAPRLAGDRVVLDIASQRAAPGAAPGSVQSHRVETTLSARLGEWIEIGGAAGLAGRDDRGIGSAGRVRSAESRRIWLKVDDKTGEMRN